MREKLIDLICSTEYGNGSLVGKNFQKGFVEKIADHIIANGVTLANLDNKLASNKWIPVTERLPENKGNYLGFTGSTFMVGYYKGDGIWWIWANDREGENLFTHWMPLPQPPKGD